MNASLATGGLSNEGRPRLTPGVPMGGIAAVAVTVGIVAWGLAVGPDDSTASRVAEGLRVAAVVHASMPSPPAPPAPPGVASHRVIGAVDLRAIAAAANAASEAAAKMAVAPSEAMDGLGGDVTIIERWQNVQSGENRVVAEAMAPAGLRLARVYGPVTVEVVPGADRIRFEMLNSRKRYNLDVRDGLLWISGPGPSDQPTEFKITMPPGGALLINEYSGEMTVKGPLNAPVRLDLVQGSIAFDGPAQSVRARISGSGQVRLAEVRDLLAVQMRGSGDVTVGRAQRLSVEMDGSGAVNIGGVGGEAILDVPGSGAVNIGALRGALRAAIPGSGDVNIASGQADSFEAAVMGTGNLRFGGTAVDPRVVVAGSGDVVLSGHTGTPRVERVGSGRVELGN